MKDNWKIIFEALKLGAVINLGGLDHTVMNGSLYVKFVPVKEDCGCDEEQVEGWIESDMRLNDFIGVCEEVDEEKLKEFIISNTMIKTGRWRRYDDI